MTWNWEYRWARSRMEACTVKRFGFYPEGKDRGFYKSFNWRNGLIRFMF